MIADQVSELMMYKRVEIWRVEQCSLLLWNFGEGLIHTRFALIKVKCSSTGGPGKLQEARVVKHAYMLVATRQWKGSILATGRRSLHEERAVVSVTAAAGFSQQVSHVIRLRYLGGQLSVLIDKAEHVIIVTKRL